MLKKLSTAWQMLKSIIQVWHIVLLGSIASSVLIVVIIVCLAHFLPPEKDDVLVTTNLISEADSPDHLWKARVEEIIREGTFVTTINAAVQLIPASNPSDIIDILWADTRVQERPRIAWTSANTLAATVFDIHSVAVERCDYGGIHIDLKLDPAEGKTCAAYEESQKHREEAKQIKKNHPESFMDHMGNMIIGVIARLLV
jgi:hypothetical protein